MNRKSTAPIPEAITKLQRQLEQFRSAQPSRTKRPQSLWQAAVELARQHGVYAVAHPLRLDYTRLKQRLGGIPDRRRKANKPAFIELILAYDGQGFWLATKRLSKGRFRWWPTGTEPKMKELHDWMEAQLAEHKTEPNSGLGKAISYSPHPGCGRGH